MLLEYALLAAESAELIEDQVGAAGACACDRQGNAAGVFSNQLKHPSLCQKQAHGLHSCREHALLVMSKTSEHHLDRRVNQAESVVVWVWV